MLNQKTTSSVNTLIEVKGLKKYFPIKSDILRRTIGQIRAVDGISFTIQQGKTLGLVGESGAGKSTVGRTIIGLYPPTEGEVLFNNQNILNLPHNKFRKIRRRMQMVFQDPDSSLNPRITVGNTIREALRVSGKKGSREEAIELLNKVGLNEEHHERYNHELSGGQKQRVSVARALAVDPKFIVLDEPVASLDVSIRSQIVNLFVDLQKEFNLTYLFVSHDLSIVRYLSDQVAVMYLGKVMEEGPVNELFKSPLHPYTQILIEAIPNLNPDAPPRKKLAKGEIPSPAHPPTGCRFITRCPYAYDKCTTEPDLIEIKQDHYVACHLIKSAQ